LTDTPLDETLTEINRTIDLLRFERYAQTASREQSSSVKAAVRNVYYLLRPLFPVAFRKHLQRIALRGWDAKSFPSWPVDIRTEKLMDTVWRRMLDSSGLQALPFIWFWPDGHSSACIMTHDVETKFGRDFCGEMMRMERRHGVVSAFEVVPEERYEVPSSFLDEIREMGCEVCIHGLNHDGHDFTSRELFLERAKKINAYAEEWGARGYRSPVLYRNLEWINALKFSYDLSVPNVGHLDPQPGGCCTVMPYFIGEMLELPLTTIQDYSLFNILQQRSLDLWAKQISLIREQHGLISFIIHPDYVQDPWAKDLYDGLLQYLAELRNSERVWIALPRDVDDWWRARREMQLIQKNGNWVIQGPQAERARVAYASMEGGRLTFSVENRG
jgi:peptidoglycan/xylan/chitin deacetylase (PgdA/CDA1 family)